MRRRTTRLGYALLSVALAASALSAQQASAQERPAAPATTTPAAPATSTTVVEVKFVEGTRVRLREGELESEVGAAGVSQVQAILGAAQVNRLFSTPEATLAENTAAAQATTDRRLPDLNQWYLVQVANRAEQAKLIADLNALDIVETAYAQPIPTAPTAPDLSGHQTYGDPASSDGIDSDYAKTTPGGGGANVKIVDIEQGWDTAHKDLTKLALTGALIPQGTPEYNEGDHGTAVMGIIGADKDSSSPKGMVGLVPDAGLHFTNVRMTGDVYNVSNAISVASNGVAAGDILLIEQQIGGCNDWVPVEHQASSYDAIVTAVAAGRHVVEAAGNGNRNLDASCFGPTFPDGKPDSGAIMVGAGGAPCGTPRSRMSFSNYGTRVDVQGWGECVATTGGPTMLDLYDGGLHDQYTSVFAGTSSASPMVAAAVAALTGVAKQDSVTLTPAQVRDILIWTGTAQTGNTAEHIGPLPNMRTVLDNYDTDAEYPVRITKTAPQATVLGGTANLKIGASDANLDALTFSATGLPTGLSINTSTGVITGTATATGLHTVTVSVTDGNHSPVQTQFTWRVADPDCTGTQGAYVPIPDNSTVYSDLVIANCVETAADTSLLKVSVPHTWRGDVVIDLVAPDGTHYRVKNSDPGDGGYGVEETYPVDLSSESVNGTWRLKVADVLTGDTGFINSYTLTLANS